MVTRTLNAFATRRKTAHEMHTVCYFPLPLEVVTAEGFEMNSYLISGGLFRSS